MNQEPWTPEQWEKVYAGYLLWAADKKASDISLQDIRDAIGAVSTNQLGVFNARRVLTHAEAGAIWYRTLTSAQFASTVTPGENPGMLMIEVCPPLLEDDFHQLSTYLHTKVMWCGDWVFSIKMYKDESSLKSTEDNDDEDSSQRASAPVITYALKSKWDWLTYSWGAEVQTVEEAHVIANEAIPTLINHIRSAIFQVVA